MRLPLLLSLTALLACAELDADDDDKDPPGPRDRDDTGQAAHDGGSGDGGSADGGNADGGAADGGASDGGSGDGGSGDGGGQTAEDAAEACHPDLADWPEEWAAIEEAVLERTNAARAQGQDCGSYGIFGPAGPLTMEPHLRCAARYHSLWMAQTGTFDHYSVGGDLGEDPWQRIANAGFTGSAIGENIAAGYGSAAEVVQGWIDSDGHCANLMNPSAGQLGVGYAQGGPYGTYWTQDFAI